MRNVADVALFASLCALVVLAALVFSPREAHTDTVDVVSVVAMQDGAIMGTTDKGGGYVEGSRAAGSVFRLKLTPHGWVHEGSWGLCFWWHDCDRYGLPSGELKLVAPNTIKGTSERDGGRHGVDWTFQFYRGRTYLTPRRWW